MDKLLNLLGLAMRAGKVVTGEEQVIKAVRTKRATLVFLSVDAARNVRKKVENKCAFYQVPTIQYGTRRELGSAVGKPERVVIAVTDPGFTRSMLHRLKASNGGDEVGKNACLRIRKKDEHEQQRGYHHPKTDGDGRQ